MPNWRASGLAIFAVVCLLGETASSAHAQCAIFGCATEWSGNGSVTNLEGPPGSLGSIAEGINNTGQAVGVSIINGFGDVSTEWSGGKVINLGGLPGSNFSLAMAINDAGQAVGVSETVVLVPESSTWAMCWSALSASPWLAIAALKQAPQLARGNGDTGTASFPYGGVEQRT